jgi:hypothetical protein
MGWMCDSTHVQLIFGKDALAAGSEGSQGTGDLIPAAKVGLQLESDVARGVEALAVPKRGHGVGDFRGVLAGRRGRSGEQGEDGE